MTEKPFHIRIADERDRRGWSQQRAADAAGMSLRAYTNFEKGKTKPQAKHLRGILDAFDLDGSRTADPAAPHSLAVGQLCPTCHRPVFPEQIEAFRNMIGAQLLTLPEDEQLERIFAETRRIFESVHKPVDRDTT